MKMRTKVIAGFVATVFALVMITQAAFAATNPIFVYDNAAGAQEDSKATVICELLSGGGNQDGFNGPVYAELQAIAPEAASVDVLLTGDFTGVAHLNFVGDFDFTPDGSGYDNKTYAGKDITVDGHLVYSGEFGAPAQDARFAFLLRNKSEGRAVLEAYILRNADGEIIGGMDGSGFIDASKAEALYNDITSGNYDTADDASASTAEATPKTGVASAALFLGLGAVISGACAVALKKKED